MLFTVGIYHYGQTALAIGFDAVRGTMEERHASGLIDAVDKHYQKLGLKVIAVADLGQDRLHASCSRRRSVRTAISKASKVRGTPAYHPVIRTLGGAPVVLPIPEVYTALEKGVIDGAASPVVGLLGVKWYEVAKYVSQPSLRLRPPALPHEPRHLEPALRGRQDGPARRGPQDRGGLVPGIRPAWREAEIKELERQRRRPSPISAASQAKLNEVWSEGLWELAEKKSPAEAKELLRRSPSRRG